MTTILRILAGWVCVGVGFYLMWKLPRSWFFVLPFIVLFFLWSRFLGGPPGRELKDKRFDVLVLVVFGSIPSLLGTYSSTSWLCWLMIVGVVVWGAARDLMSSSGRGEME